MTANKTNPSGVGLTGSGWSRAGTRADSTSVFTDEGRRQPLGAVQDAVHDQKGGRENWKRGDTVGRVQ